MIVSENEISISWNKADQRGIGFGDIRDREIVKGYNGKWFLGWVIVPKK